jgi:hypothetical protein
METEFVQHPNLTTEQALRRYQAIAGWCIIVVSFVSFKFGKRRGSKKS